MKRRLLFFAFVMLLTITSFAQTNRGWRSVGGTGFMKARFKVPSFQVNLSPELYWFIADDFALGLDFGFGFGSTKQNDSTSASFLNGYIAPGMRYYFRDIEKKWRPYAFLNAGIETYANRNEVSNVTFKSDETGFVGYLGGGLAWFFNEHAAFDMRLHLLDYTRNDARFNPAFSIGIQAFFD